MKICPQCNKTYSDDTLNFCLDDGSVLTRQDGSSSPPPTVMIPDPRTDAVNQAPFTQFQEPEVPTAVRQGTVPRKKSRAWIWVLGILAGVAVVCGGGFIGLVAFLPADQDSNDGTVLEERDGSDRTGTDSSRKLVKEDEIGGWEVYDNDYISSKVKDGALILTSVTGYYYVILAEGFDTRDASVALEVKNTTGGVAESGFGLVIHSAPDSVLERDYAFLIRSDNGTYRIVQHTKKMERELFGWTDSDAIRGGTKANVLEVRVDGSDMNFYINGEFIRKVKDYTNYKDGIAGIYTSDDVPIAFSKIELRK